MGVSDDVEKLQKNQASLQRTVTTLKTRVDEMSARLARLEGKPVPEEEPETVSAPEKKVNKSKETDKDSENTGFKIFGAVGFFLILLGLFYIYTYAVSQGWITYGGRIAIGVIFSLIIIGLGELFRRKAYERFSQLLIGGGVGLLYFTTYATYAFPAYRAALGMSRLVNTFFLFVVVGIAVYLALRQDSQILACFSFLLGYTSAFLAETVHQTMIATIILSIGMAYLIWKRNWQLGLYPVIASYVTYMLFFFTQRVMAIRYAYPSYPQTAAVIPSIVLPAFIYLIIFFVLFNLLSLFLRDEKDATLSVLAAVINGFLFLCFGLSIVWRYWESYRGAFLVLVAAGYFCLTFLAKQREQRTMFETFFILAIVYLTIAIPVQLDKVWIGVAWAVEGFLLVRSGLRVETRGIRAIGYVALGLAAIYALFWGTFTLKGGERMFTYLATLLALYGTAYLLSIQKELDDAQVAMKTVLAMIACVLLTIVLAVEISDSNGLLGVTSSSARHVTLTIAWAIEAMAFIVLGFMARSVAFRIFGAVLFGIVILKILTVDLSGMETIYRIVVTMIVGIISLASAFAYVKNKDRIQEFLQEK